MQCNSISTNLLIERHNAIPHDQQNFLAKKFYLYSHTRRPKFLLQKKKKKDWKPLEQRNTGVYAQQIFE